jgi:hypothetical protein
MMFSHGVMTDYVIFTLLMTFTFPFIILTSKYNTAGKWAHCQLPTQKLGCSCHQHVCVLARLAKNGVMKVKSDVMSHDLRH